MIKNCIEVLNVFTKKNYKAQEFDQALK